ncbi:MAG: ATP synthase F1 subunit delta [Bacteroidota bacterium]|nr:ATP synthase F1 subunit delta [Bacteroidota bacterium]
MNHIRLAQRYAKALFELAVEQNVMEQVKTDMSLVVEVFNNRDFRNMIFSPIIRQEKKQDIIREIFKKSVAELSLLYILLIIKKKRESFLKEIAEQYIEIYKLEKGIITTTIKTTISLDAKLREQIISLMKSETKSEIELIEEVDENLLGGFVLEYNDKLYDASVRRKLSKLRRELI